MNNDERQELLVEATDLICEAEELIKAAVSELPCEPNVKAYLLQSITNILAGEDCNPHAQSIASIAEMVSKECAS